MSVPVIERPLLVAHAKLKGKSSYYRHATWVLVLACIPCMYLAGVTYASTPLGKLPFLAVGVSCALTIWASEVARHYDYDEPHYKVSRSRVYLLVHMLWIVGIYAWLCFWLLGLGLGIYTIVSEWAA